jgi:hypothetical protein
MKDVNKPSPIAQPLSAKKTVQQETVKHNTDNKANKGDDRPKVTN